MESSLKDPSITSTHANVVTDPMVSHSGSLAQDKSSKSSELTQSTWEKIPNEVPPDPEFAYTGSSGETDCTGRSNPANVASVVSANNAETLGGLSGDLGQTSAVGPPIDEAIHSSCPTSISDEALDAITKMVWLRLHLEKRTKDHLKLLYGTILG